jgi:hypothetical protein
VNQENPTPYVEAANPLAGPQLPGKFMFLAPLIHFYHGTTLDKAKGLLGMDLSPQQVPDSLLLDWREYTDFGKGFYTHPHETRNLAVVWAKGKAKKAKTDWGVARFSLTAQEFKNITGTSLVFDNKTSRPPNAPVFAPPNPASWLEFVEFNRGIQGTVQGGFFPDTGIQRPKDKDWTAQYPWMRGPMWSRADSAGSSGVPLGTDDIGIALPDNLHQINWGLAGLAALNAPAAKNRRFLFNKDNEGSI